MTTMVATADSGGWAQAGQGEEALLVARARDGDSRAFEQLYRGNVERIFGLCMRLCHGDRAKAEQATQDAFVRAWEKLESFRGDAQFSTWLHRVTVNVVLGEHRLLQRWTTFEDAEAAGTPEELSVPAEDPTLSRDLERALAKLPKGARTVLWLYDVEGYQHNEIAELTGIAVGTSKAQLHRARKMMKEHLQ
jgi:RNA polymerase sigma factor (sigma-70 family)